MATVISTLRAPFRPEQFGDSSYPTRDGRPMGETDLHRRIMIDVIGALEQFYAGQQVYVSGNLLLFYEPENRRKHVSPDVLVTKGLKPGLRLNYILWQEGLPPNVVIEVTSKSTRKEDIEKKFEIYRDVIRVAEYFVFDPYSEYLDPPLQGYRLADGRYDAITLVNGRLACEQLDLELEGQKEALRLYDRRTSQPLLTPREEVERLRSELQRAGQAKSRRP